jgi:hypothetical protein
MPQTRWLLAGVLTAAVAVVLLFIVIGGSPLTGDGGPQPTDPEPTSRSSAAAASATPVAPVATSVVSAAPSGPTATPARAPSRAPVTAAPRASGPPLVAWAAFLAHLNEDRATVEGLNAELTTAAQAQDPDAVKAAAVDILDFVDIERDWLREHPPADCYADAHASAAAMLDAYGTAADRFVDWTTTGGGLGGLPALGVAVEAADAARAAFTTFAAAMEATTCPR